MLKIVTEVCTMLSRQVREDPDCWKYPFNPSHSLGKGIFSILISILGGKKRQGPENAFSFFIFTFFSLLNIDIDSLLIT